jgi:transposase
MDCHIIAHSIMTIVYHLLTRREDYKELGGQQVAIVKQTVRKQENLGFSVTLSAPETS